MIAFQPAHGSAASVGGIPHAASAASPGNKIDILLDLIFDILSQLVGKNGVPCPAQLCVLVAVSDGTPANPAQAENRARGADDPAHRPRQPADHRFWPHPFTTAISAVSGAPMNASAAATAV